MRKGGGKNNGTLVEQRNAELSERESVSQFVLLENSSQLSLRTGNAKNGAR